MLPSLFPDLFEYFSRSSCIQYRIMKRKEICLAHSSLMDTQVRLSSAISICCIYQLLRSNLVECMENETIFIVREMFLAYRGYLF